MTEAAKEHMPEPRSALERHAQTLILSVVTGLILWIGVSVTGSRESLARMEVRMDSMESSMKDLKDALNGAYTRAEADRAHAEFDRRISVIENRLLRYERGQ